jgi:Holliday junction resolvase RusA-like endonuclease
MIKLEGRILSKKRRYRRGKNGSFYLDKRFKQFEEKMLWQLKNYKEKYKGMVYISYTFKIKGNYRLDVDNAVVTVNDLLEKAGVIEDDNLVVSGEFAKYQGHDSWATLVEIEELDKKQ